MPIYSADYGYLFLQNPQTASTATARTLVSKLHGIHLQNRLDPSEKAKQRDVVHMHPAEILELELLTRAEYDSALKVTGVRNPYDMLFSRYLKRANPVVPLEEQRYALLRPGGEKLRASYERATRLSFPEWIKAQFGHKRRGKGQDVFVQASDMVIRFEALREDFAAFLRRIGADETIEVEPFNVSPQRLGEEATKLPYAAAYDEESRGIVARVFASTIERFDYSF